MQLDQTHIISMQRVICIGSASQDIFFPTQEGTLLATPEDITAQVKVAFEVGGKFRAAKRYESIGGVAANVALGLAQLSLEASCYSHVGGDELGLWIKRTLEQGGVKTDLLERDPAVRSDLSAIIVLQQTGDRLIFHNRDANERLVVQAPRLADGDWLYVSALNGAWRENLATILAACRQDAKLLALNPGQHNLKDDPALMLQCLREVDALFLNKDEAIELCLANALETDAQRLNDERLLIQLLHQQGPRVVAMTDGKRGAWTTDGKAVWQAQSYEPHGLVDTTGAGDAFGSGFFGAYLKGLALETCLKYGIINAGSVTGYYGAVRGLLDEAAIGEWLPRVKTTRLA